MGDAERYTIFTLFLFPKQLQRAVGELVGNYTRARRSIREAAEAAETVGERVIRGDDLQVGLFRYKHSTATTVLRDLLLENWVSKVVLACPDLLNSTKPLLFVVV